MTTPATPALLKTKAAALAQVCEQCLPLSGARLGPEYYYHSLPLCIIDAVFSIGVRYDSVTSVVNRYCNYFALPSAARGPGEFPPESRQQSVSELVANMEKLGIEAFTSDVFQNRQRTSSRGGILKSEAVLRFARALRDHGIDYLQDIASAMSNEELNAALRQIPGQRSGISVRYFFMLAGVEHLVKPDRWIMRFLERGLGVSATLDEAQSLISDTCKILQQRYPYLTPLLLDNLIWNYERAR